MYLELELTRLIELHGIAMVLRTLADLLADVAADVATVNAADAKRLLVVSVALDDQIRMLPSGH
jgi:hypothetical protein